MTITAVDPVSRADPASPPARIAVSEVAIVVGIGLLTVAVVPNWSSSAWVPKEAVLGVLAAAGLPVLAFLALGRGRDIPGNTRLAARLAAIFVVVALVSALASKTPGLAMVGLYQQGTGWVFVAGLAGCWALGTRLGPRGRDLLQLVIIFCAVANAVVGMLQLTGDLGRFGLPLYGGSLIGGLQGNPFEFGALMAAGLALLVIRFVQRPREWYLPVAVVMIGAGACGERLPLLLIVAVLAWALWRAAGLGSARTREVVRSTVALGALTLVSLLAGALIASWVNAGGSISRVEGSTSEETFGQRLMAWREGLRAFTHHLLIGAGPGQFRSVTSALFPLSFVKPAPGEVFTDAHNFIVEYLTTTGILGALAFLTFLGVILFRARGPLALAAVVLIAIELAEPLNAAVFPVALAALAAAGPLTLREPQPLNEPKTLREPPPLREPSVVDEPRHRHRRSSDGPDPFPPLLRVVIGVLCAVGLVAGLVLVVGDGLMLRGDEQRSLAQDSLALGNAQTADDLLPVWPEPAVLISETHFYLGLGDHPKEWLMAIHWAQVAVSRDPTNSSLLVMLSTYQLVAGQFRAAQQSALQAQVYLPWYPSALNNLGIASLVLGEKSEAHHWFALSLEVAPDQQSIRGLYDGSCKLELSQIGISQLSRVCSGSGH